MKWLYNYKDLETVQEQKPPVDADLEAALEKMAYVMSHMRRPRSPVTIKGRQDAVKSLRNKLGGFEFSQDWIDRALGNLKHAGKPDHVINFYAYAIKSLYEANGHPDVNIPISTSIDIPEALHHSEAQIMKMIGLSKHKRDKAILNALYFCMPRNAELCNLTVQDVNLKTKLMTIRATKTRKVRVIPIDDRAIPSLATWLDLRNSMVEDEPMLKQVPWFFVNQLGTRMGQHGIRGCVEKHAKLAGIKSHPHAWRHSRIYALLEQEGVPIHIVARWAGDKVSTIEQFYSHTGTVEMQAWQVRINEKHK